MRWVEIKPVGSWYVNGQRMPLWGLYLSGGYYDDFCHRVSAERVARNYLTR